MSISRRGCGLELRRGTILPGLHRVAAGLSLAVLLVACDSVNGPGATPTASPNVTTNPDRPPSTAATATLSPSATPSATPIVVGDEPRRIELPQGAELDASPTVVFVEPLGGASEAWVFPATATPDFQVSPDGRLIFWTGREPLSQAQRAVLADQLLEELAPFLENGERNQVRGDLDALATGQWRDDETWVPIATELVDQLRERLPPELAGRLKDRLSDIALGGPPDMQRHLLDTTDGSDQIVDWQLLEFAPAGGRILALRRDADEDESFLVLDGAGEFVRELEQEPDALASVSAWSPDGDAIAITTQTVRDESDITLRLEIWPVPDGAPVEVIEIPVDAHAAVSLAWSDGGDRLALATRTTVRVFDRDGALLWEQAGEFENARNLVWSASGYLHLHTTRLTEDQENVPFGYVFSQDGEVHFRVRWLRTCTGTPWLPDGSGLRDGRHVVMLTGELDDLGEERAGDLTSPVHAEQVNLRWSREDDGQWRVHRLDAEGDIFLLSVPGQVGINSLDGDRGPWTTDGRYLFSTPVVGRGGCGEGWSGTPEPPSVQYPSFEGE